MNGRLELALTHKLIQAKVALALSSPLEKAIDRETCSRIHGFLTDAESTLDLALLCLHQLLFNERASTTSTSQDLSAVLALARIAFNALASLSSPGALARTRDLNSLIESTTILALRVLYKIQSAAINTLSMTVSQQHATKSLVRTHANSLAELLVQQEGLRIKLRLLAEGRLATTTAVNNLWQVVFSALHLLDRGLVNQFLCNLTILIDESSLRAVSCSVVLSFIESAPCVVWRNNNLALTVFDQIVRSAMQQKGAETVARSAARLLKARRENKSELDMDVLSCRVVDREDLEHLTVEVEVVIDGRTRLLRGVVTSSDPPSSTAPKSSEPPPSIYLPTPSRVTLPPLTRRTNTPESGDFQSPGRKSVMSSTDDTKLPPRPLARSRTLAGPKGTPPFWRGEDHSSDDDSASDALLVRDAMTTTAAESSRPRPEMPRRHSSVVAPRRPPEAPPRRDRLAATKTLPRATRFPEARQRSATPLGRTPTMARSPVRAPVGRMYEVKRAEVISVRRPATPASAVQRKVSLFSTGSEQTKTPMSSLRQRLPTTGILQRGDSSTVDGSVSHGQLNEPVYQFGTDPEDCSPSLISVVIACLGDCCQASAGRASPTRKPAATDAIPESFEQLKASLRSLDPNDPSLPALDAAKQKGGQWLIQFHALSLVRRMAIHHPAQLEHHDGLTQLFLLLARCADSLRSSVARQALSVIQDFYQVNNAPYKRLLDQGVPHLLPACLRKSADQTNLFLSDAAASAVNAIVRCGSEVHCLSVIRAVVLQAKHALLRAQLLRATRILVERCQGKLVNIPEVDKLIAFAVKSLRDAATDSRQEAKLLCRAINEALQYASSLQVGKVSTKVRPEEWQKLRSLA